MFSIVETYQHQKDHHAFKQKLADADKFENAFAGASEQDCQTWAREEISHNKSIMSNVIVVIDQRSATDETVSVQMYSEGPGLNMPGFGRLPKERNKWYCFRVPYQEAATIHTDLNFGPVEAYPVYYGCKDELTDEQGVFHVDKAVKLLGDPKTWQDLS